MQFKDGRDSYTETTLMKRLGKRSYESLVKTKFATYREEMEKIRGEYDAGARRVPCITLQCIGYNEPLCQDILACRPSASAAIGKRKRQPRQNPDGSEAGSPTASRVRVS